MANNLTNSEKTGLVASFSGADVVVIFGDEYIGECMSFSIGVNREAGPIYTMGRKSHIAVAKGKRGVGGSFILAQLGYDALLTWVANVIQDPKYRQIFIRKDENVAQIAEGTRKFNDPTTQAGVQNLANATAGAGTAPINPIPQTNIWEQVAPFYVDQLPPINITVIGRNEQGDMMGFRVYGMSILNEGMSISIDELNMEKRYTFIAKDVSKMMRLNYDITA
jgi:hypothetical protein